MKNIREIMEETKEIVEQKKGKEYQVIYHKEDFDGLCSAAIIAQYFKDQGISIGKIEFSGFSWEDKEYPEFLETKETYLVDLTFDKEKMLEIKERARDFIWIDHHKKKYQDLYKEEPRFKHFLGTRRDDLSACEITFFEFLSDPSDYDSVYDISPELLEKYEIVFLLGRQDVWDLSNKLIPWHTIKKFQYGLRRFIDPLKKSSIMLLREIIFDFSKLKRKAYIKRAIEVGTDILSYQENIFKNDRENVLKTVLLLDGKKFNVAVLNSSHKGSMVFGDYSKSKDVLFNFRYLPAKNMYTLSFYSEKDGVDMSGLAKWLGGGGHPGASGALITPERFNKVFGDIFKKKPIEINIKK